MATKLKDLLELLFILYLAVNVLVKDNTVSKNYQKKSFVGSSGIKKWFRPWWQDPDFQWLLNRLPQLPSQNLTAYILPDLDVRPRFGPEVIASEPVQQEPSLEDIDLIDILWRQDFDQNKGNPPSVESPDRQHERDMDLLLQKEAFHQMYQPSRYWSPDVNRAYAELLQSQEEYYKYNNWYGGDNLLSKLENEGLSGGKDLPFLVDHEQDQPTGMEIDDDLSKLNLGEWELLNEYFDMGVGTVPSPQPPVTNGISPVDNLTTPTLDLSADDLARLFVNRQVLADVSDAVLEPWDPPLGATGGTVTDLLCEPMGSPDSGYEEILPFEGDAVVHDHCYSATQDMELFTGTDHRRPRTLSLASPALTRGGHEEKNDDLFLNELGIPLSRAEIAEMTTEQFTRLTKSNAAGFTEIQMNALRAVRRRIKNQINARNSRQRRVDAIRDLEEKIEQLCDYKGELEHENAQLEKFLSQEKGAVDSLLRQNGLGHLKVDDVEFAEGSDGEVVVVVKSKGADDFKS